MILTTDLSNLPPEMREQIVKHLRHEDAAAYALAKVEQEKVAKFYHDHIRPGFTKDGIGPMSLVIHPYFRNMLQAEHGGTIFTDPDFVEWLKRNHDCFRVPEVGTRVQLGYTGRGSQKPGARSQKSEVRPSKRLEVACG